MYTLPKPPIMIQHNSKMDKNIYKNMDSWKRLAGAVKLHTTSLCDEAVIIQRLILAERGAIKMSKLIKYEPSHEKTNNLHMRKQRRRSAVQ